MKRDIENLDFRAAFRPVPEACRAALMDAARSVKEERKMKRASLRVALIAAAIVVSMMAAALAAGHLMGWTDFLGDYSNVNIPQGAVEQMQVTEELSWQVGPMTFTVTELLTDGRIAVSSVNIRTTDGSPALMCWDPWDTIGCNGDNGKANAVRLGIDPTTTYIEAAKQLNLPLYTVRGILDVAAEYIGGESMEDPMWNEDGSVTYFCMIDLADGAVRETLPTGLFLRVSRIDPASGEEAEKWVDREQTVLIPVCPVLEKRSYVPDRETIIAGQKLLKVDAVRYVTGAYLTLTWEMDAMLMPEKVWELYDLTLLDADGAPLPRGMNLSASMMVTITQEEMLGVESLPDVITLDNGTVLVAE